MNPPTTEEIQDFVKKLSYRRVVGFAIFFAVFGAVFYHLVEKLSWLDSFYFTVITLVTVGYGDITPKTAAGKIFTIFYVFFGITIFLVLAKLVVTRAAMRAKARRQK